MEVALHNGTHIGLSGMNLLDWLIILVLAISVITAFMSGLIRSVLSLAGLVVGVLVGGWYAAKAAIYLKPWITQPALAQIIAFVLILVTVYVLAVLIGRLLHGAFKAVGLGFLDRLGGAVFGFVRGAILLAAILLPAAPFLQHFPAAKDSVLLPYLLPAAHGISFVVPRDFGKYLPQGSWWN